MMKEGWDHPPLIDLASAVHQLEARMDQLQLGNPATQLPNNAYEPLTTLPWPGAMRKRSAASPVILEPPVIMPISDYCSPFRGGDPYNHATKDWVFKLVNEKISRMEDRIKILERRVLELQE